MNIIKQGHTGTAASCFNGLLGGNMIISCIFFGCIGLYFLGQWWFTSRRVAETDEQFIRKFIILETERVKRQTIIAQKGDENDK